MLVGHERAGCGAAGALPGERLRRQLVRDGTAGIPSCVLTSGPRGIFGELHLGIVPGGASDRQIWTCGRSVTGVSRQPSRSRTTGWAGALGHDVRAAPRAEAAELAGRGFEGAQKFRGRAIQRNFSRGTAVTDEKAAPWVLRQVWQWQCTMRSRGGVGLVGDAAAQAASRQHAVLRCRRQGRRGRLRR